MTTLYLATLIRDTAHAEGMAVGTVAMAPSGNITRTKGSDGRWWNGPVFETPPDQLGGWTALVASETTTEATSPRDAEFNSFIGTQCDAARAQVRAARELHSPVEIEPSSTICAECSTKCEAGALTWYQPTEEWPCPTILALDGAGEGTPVGQADLSGAHLWDA